MNSDLITFAQDLVRTKSLPGQEEAAIQLAAAKMRALGFDEVSVDSMGNVIGRIGNSGPSILFDSHLDTVDVNDDGEWNIPPFSGAVIDGRLHGRGSVDMKSAAAASIYAAVTARESGAATGKTIYVSCTVQEEDCDGENLKHLFNELALRPDAVVVCEPSNNQIALGHKGKAQIIIKTQGVSAHSAAPEKGKNAIYEMAEIIQRVEQLNDRLAAQPKPRGSIVMSRISSVSASLNAVPSECEIYLDRRTVPSETDEMIKHEIEQLIAGKQATWQTGTLHRTSWTGLTVAYDPFHSAWQLDAEHELAQAGISAYQHCFDAKPTEFVFWDFSTNAVTPVSLGIPTIGFGPGDYRLAHMPNESCPVAQIVDACRFYTALIEQI